MNNIQARERSAKKILLKRHMGLNVNIIKAIYIQLNIVKVEYNIMLDFEKIEWSTLPLGQIKRKIEFPYQLSEIGIIRNHLMSEAIHDYKLEIVIRLSSAEKHSVDIIDGKKYTMGYPNVIVKIPGVKYQYSISEPRDAIYFSYPPELADAMRRTNLFPDPPVWEIKMTSGIKDIIHELTEFMEHSREYSVVDRMDLLAFRLYEELLFIRHNVDHQDEFIEARMQRIESYFQVNFNKDFDFDKLVRDNGLSRRSFFRHWKKYSGLPAKLYLQDLKLKEACRLLTVTDKKVCEIAAIVNFQDSAYFCALFRKQYGCTPLQYREKHFNEIK